MHDQLINTKSEYRYMQMTYRMFCNVICRPSKIYNATHKAAPIRGAHGSQWPECLKEFIHLSTWPNGRNSLGVVHEVHPWDL